MYSVYAFLIIFCPPITPRFDVLLILFAAFEIYRKYRQKIIDTLVRGRIIAFDRTMLLLAVYVALVPLPVSAFLYNDTVQIGHYISLVNRYGLLLVVMTICGTHLILELESRKYNVEDFLKIIFRAGAIESTFAVGALLSPTFKQVLTSIMRRNTGNSLYENIWYITVRSYGFANTLVDLFGFGISVIASACFAYGVFKNKKYILLSAYISIASALNSRTGFIMYCISVLLTLLYLLLKGNAKGITLGVIFAVVGFITFNFLMSSDWISQNTKYWIDSGIESFIQIIKGEDVSSGSLSVLFQESWWDLPDTIRTIIGTGHSRYQAEGYVHTDVGYINEIWLFGIVGTAFLYFNVVKMTYLSAIQNKNELLGCIGFIVCAEYFAFNIKAVALGYNPGATVMMLLLFGISYFTSVKEGK